MTCFNINTIYFSLDTRDMRPNLHFHAAHRREKNNDQKLTHFCIQSAARSKIAEASVLLSEA